MSQLVHPSFQKSCRHRVPIPQSSNKTHNKANYQNKETKIEELREASLAKAAAISHYHF